MNLGFEYLLRHNLGKSFLRLPCSVFLAKTSRTTASSRIAVYIDEKDGRYTVKQWMLTDCESCQALPPMEEFYVDDPLKELDWVIPKGYRPIQYIPGAVVNRQNTWRKPMTKKMYDEFFDQMVDSPWHRAWKSLWLWQTFIWVYFGTNQKECPYGRMFQIDRGNLQGRVYPICCKYMQKDLRLLIDHSYKLYTHWEMWCSNILLESSSPGELVFADPERYFEEAKKRQFPPLERFRMPRFKNHKKKEFIPPATANADDGVEDVLELPDGININDLKKALMNATVKKKDDKWTTLIYHEPV